MAIKRIGIFGGSFDPVHKGHIAFALQVIEEAELDEVYFLPEVKPRRKPSVSHISHRVAMLKEATRPYEKLKVLELPDRQFSVSNTFPKLQKKFKSSDLFLLMGTDVADHLDQWPNAEKLLNEVSLVIVSRNDEPKFGLPAQPKKLYVLKSLEPKVSSSQIREAAEHGKTANGSLESSNKYIKEHWLYSTAPKSS